MGTALRSEGPPTRSSTPFGASAHSMQDPGRRGGLGRAAAVGVQHLPRFLSRPAQRRQAVVGAPEAGGDQLLQLTRAARPDATRGGPLRQVVLRGTWRKRGLFHQVARPSALAA